MGILPSSISNQFKSVLYYNPHDIDILSQRVGNTSTVAGWLRALAKEPNRGSAVDAWCGVPTVLKQKKHILPGKMVMLLGIMCTLPGNLEMSGEFSWDLMGRPFGKHRK
jgi:hypothetical protein